MSLRNRIAFYFVTVTALSTAVLFFVIFYIVHDTVYYHLDTDLETEFAEVSSSIVILNDQIIFANNYEWGEKEHGQAEVNPTFIQLIDTAGNTIRKTINLRSGNLFFNNNIKDKESFDLHVDGSAVRQLQAPLKNEKKEVKAYLLIAIPLEESMLVLTNLKTVLMISFPVVLILLFSISRIIAGRIVSPVNNIISTAEHITSKNLNERIPAAPRKDELYKLTNTINNLLDRLEDTVLREQQFTSDASHELRTPIAVIKGTLEVLIRKEREPEQYKEKIKYVINEVDRMARLVEQLLSLARYESNKIEPMIGELELNKLVNKILDRFTGLQIEKNISLSTELVTHININADTAMTEIILENLVSNAFKYCNKDGSVKIKTEKIDNSTLLSINNSGEIISSKNLQKIFDRFYRADESRNAEVEGIGLGLAIVKRLTDLQGFSISAESNELDGTTFKIEFPS